MDWWYLLPVALTDRLGGGALWSLVLVSGAVAFGVPWSLGRPRQRPATVMEQRCNACTKCYQDCPYDAITMVARTDGNKRHKVRAFVNPAKCVGCSICAGSCDTAGIGVDWFAVSDQRRRFAGWLKKALLAGESPYVAFICGESAGASLDVDSVTGTCEELPGYVVNKIPCAGWLHPFGIEHTLRYGGEGVLVVSCGPSACRYREGATWEQMRIDGQREPVLRTEKVERDQVLYLALDRTRKRELVRRARAFREGEPLAPASAPASAVTGLAAALLAAIIAGGVGLVSDFGYAAPPVEGSELVVSFKHPGQIAENCRDLTEEELAKRPVHMRQARICDRARAAVRLRVDVDGARVVDAVLAPKGIWEDGNSVAIERVPVEPGTHEVRVAIGETANVDEWSYTDAKALKFDTSTRRVVTFDRILGFTWH
jgi:ferredoxin/coenzyme F420-reducing hydrogenase delta subunit